MWPGGIIDQEVLYRGQHGSRIVVLESPGELLKSLSMRPMNSGF